MGKSTYDMYFFVKIVYNLMKVVIYLRLKLRLNCEYKENNYDVQKLEKYISNHANICLLS